MNTKAPKIGRPPGASQYEQDDREALTRMRTLCEQGTPILTAAKLVVGELKDPKPSAHQAIERLRKKYQRLPAAGTEAAAEENESCSENPEPLADQISLAETRERGEQAHRWVNENRRSILDLQNNLERVREVQEAVRKSRKPEFK